MMNSQDFTENIMLKCQKSTYLKWTYGLFVHNYRDPILSKYNPTLSGIITCLNL